VPSVRAIESRFSSVGNTFPCPRCEAVTIIMVVDTVTPFRSVLVLRVLLLVTVLSSRPIWTPYPSGYSRNDQGLQ